MMQSIALTRAQVPLTLRGTYSGQKFALEASDHITIPADAGMADGGSRETYTAVDIATGERSDLRWQNAAPFGPATGRPLTDTKIPMRSGVAIVCARMFCGKDMGLRITVHPDDLQPLLPAPPADLSHEEKITLGVIRSVVSKVRTATALRNGLSAEAFEAAKARLVERGLLTRAGALTPSGRNIETPRIET